MFPLGNFEYFIENENKYTKFQDHQIVLIPASPTRNLSSSLQVIAKSRLIWLIAVLILIFTVLSYQSYQAYTKQLRIITYMHRVDELEDFMGEVKHHISAATIKLNELRHIQQLYDNSTSMATL